MPSSAVRLSKSWETICATTVTFNGAAAKFKVISSSEITTTVPSGATTGPVKVGSD
jgi:hypothetical protein